MCDDDYDEYDDYEDSYDNNDDYDNSYEDNNDYDDYDDYGNSYDDLNSSNNDNSNSDSDDDFDNSRWHVGDPEDWADGPAGVPIINHCSDSYRLSVKYYHLTLLFYIIL